MKEIKVLEKQELLEFGGCVYWWVDKYNDDYDCFITNCWDRLAKALAKKYIHKSNNIKRVVDNTNYNGTRTLKVYCQKGVFIFQYVD